MNTRNVSIVFLLTILLGVMSAQAEPLTPDDLASQREIYLRAEHALKKHDHVNYERLSQKITTYPLYPYLVYDDFKRKIQSDNPNHISLDRIKQFQQNFPDFPFNKALQNIWLTKLAKTKHWEQYVKSYQPSDNEELSCYYHYGQYQLTKDVKHLDNAKELWLVGHSQPESCERLFTVWSKNGGLTQSLIWERFRLAMNEKNVTLSKHLIKLMSPVERQAAQQWEKLLKNPNLITTDKFLDSLDASDKIEAQIVTHGLQLLAKKDPQKAMNAWKELKSEFFFTDIQQNMIQRDIGVYLSHQRSPLAKEWLAQLPNKALDSTALEWRIRLAIAENDWTSVLKWIDTLPAELKEDNSWRYWQARALEATGNQAEANQIYQQLASTRNYYGFVSSLRLKQPISIKHQIAEIDPTVMKHVSNLPAIKRFQELQLLGRDAVGRVEWFRALNKMNEQEILAAAKIAQNMDLHDIAIFTMSRADFKDDVPLRFPLAHKKEIVNNANKHNIDPAWIFAIARQESAFFNEAISSAGARGILQLLPSTAKTLAKKYDIPYESEFCLHEPNINVQLGAVYLNNLKKQMHNHTILATAAYNAGPTRASVWLPTTTQEADVWIENIPYKETREYVKNVLTFTSIYRSRLGYPAALGLMMKPIPGKKT